METLQILMQKSAGAGAGVAIGTAIGLLVRRHRTGNSNGLINGSIFVTSAVFGSVALGVMMLITYVGGF
jgi:preprotein translocase subunit SecG